MIDALNRLMYNRRQIQERRDRYSELKAKFEISIKSEGFHFKNDDIPKEKIEIIKGKIRSQIRKRRMRSYAFSISLTIVIASIIIILAVKHINK